MDATATDRAGQLAALGYQPVYVVWRPVERHWSPLAGTTGGAPWGGAEDAEKLAGRPFRLAFRPPPAVLVTDVDDHDGQGTGPATIRKMEAELGPLPPTWRLTSRGPDNPAGRYLYRIPGDLVVTDAVFGAYGGCVETVRTGHRFSWAEGDVNPRTGTPVVVYGPDGRPCAMPAVAELPEHPWAGWFRTATTYGGGSGAATADASAAMDGWRDPDAEPGEDITAEILAPWPAARHPELKDRCLHLAEYAAAGHPGMRTLFGRLAEEFSAETGRDGYAEAASLLTWWLERPQLWPAERDQREWAEQMTIDTAAIAAERAAAPPGLPAPPPVPEGYTLDGIYRVWRDNPWLNPELEYLRPYLEQRRAAERAARADPHWQPPAVAARLAALKAAALTTASLDRVEAVTPLVDGWLYLDTLAWGKGKRGGGKTVMAVDMAGCAGTGMSWHAHAVRQGPVLYLALESMPGVRQRARAWEALNGRPMTGVTFSTARLSLMDRTDADAVAAWARELGAVLVVVDTQARATPGAEENSNRDMGLFVAALDGIREACGGCVLVLHHMPRDGDNLRGATALEAAASTIIDVSGDGAMVTMRTDDDHGGRQKDAADPVPLALELTAAGPGLALGTPRAAAALDSMKEGQRKMAATIARASGEESVKVLADMAGLPEMTARRALWDLEERFWAVRSGTARRQLWAATDLCRQAHQQQPDGSVNGVSIVTGPSDVLESSHSLAPSAPKTAPGETAGQEASHQGAPAPDQPGAPAHHAPHPYRGGAGGCGDVKRGENRPAAPAEDPPVPPGYPVPQDVGMNEAQLALMAELARKQPRHVLIDGVWVSQSPGDDGGDGSHA